MRKVYYVFDTKLLDILKNVTGIRKRAYVVHSLIKAYSLLSKCEVIPVEPATEEDLLSFHCPEYLSYLQQAQNSSLNVSTDAFDPDDFNLGYDCPLFENIYSFVQLIAGSSLSAAGKLTLDIKNDDIIPNNCPSNISICQPKSYLRYKYKNFKTNKTGDDVFELPQDLSMDEHMDFSLNVDIQDNLNKKSKNLHIKENENVLAESLSENNHCGIQHIAINWFGGWHHAQRDGAEGFCYVNDIVIAIQFLLKSYKRILYIDLDVHHGNGVENAFLFSPRVFVMNIHKYESGFYPASGSVNDIGEGNGKYYTANVPLKDGITDDVYLKVFTTVAEKVLKKYKPQCIVVQCGADCISGDPLGGFNLTPVALGNCLRLVLNENLPTLLLGGGGYNAPNVARCWTYLTSVVLDCSLSNDIPDNSVETSSWDWIGIFPRGWTNLQQYVTFEWISQSVISTNSDPNKEDGEFVKRTIVFCPKYHMNCVNQSALYQFVYVGKQIEVLGVSSYFRFDLSCLNDSSLEIECLVPVTGNVRSTSVSDLGTLSVKNEISSTSIDSRKCIHTSSIHSLQNLDGDGKLTWSRMNFTDDKKNMCLMKRATVLPSGTGDSLDPYSSHSEPVFPMSLPLTQCKKCFQYKRGGEFLRSQQALQSKVGPRLEEASVFAYSRRTVGNAYFPQDKLKIVMERNKILEERTQEMKKSLERLQGESKKMKMLYYNVNKEKIAYEKFVKDFIKSLEKDSIVRVLYGNTEILVKKVNYVGMEEHPRDKKTSKKERELKAVIGLQEITIRNLINSLQEKAKSVEELNQTVKLAQVFSAARTDNNEIGIDVEESTDELSNSDATSEYEFSLTKPSPPEEVSADTDDVLDNIRRKSEMELKNIGITRSLGNKSQSDLNVTNLSIMTYDCDNDVPKKPKLVDNIDDCWPFPRNPPKTFRQKFSEGNINIADKTDVTKVGSEIKGKNCVIESHMRTDENGRDGDVEVDATVCEDYYDACEALSVRSFSPELETTEESTIETNEASEDLDGTGNTNDFLQTAITSQKMEEKMKNYEENVADVPGKFNKFTCELSIDFVQRRSQPVQESQNMICAEDQNRSERSLVGFCQSETGEVKVCSLEKDSSLITFKKSNKCLEIKITKIDKKENPTRSIHQEMVFQFSGIKTENLVIPLEESSPQPNTECKEYLGEGSEDNVCSKPEECELKSPSVYEPEEEKEPREENAEVDLFSPRTEWNDALENEDAEKIDVSSEKEEEEGQTEEHPTEAQTAGEKTMNIEEKEFGNGQQCLQSKCDDYQTFTNDSIKNLKVYQDSLRYEKNLKFLNNKSEGKDKESDDETPKEKPTAILIRSGQSKVAVIRYQ